MRGDLLEKGCILRWYILYAVTFLFAIFTSKATYDGLIVLKMHRPLFCFPLRMDPRCPFLLFFCSRNGGRMKGELSASAKLSAASSDMAARIRGRQTPPRTMRYQQTLQRISHRIRLMKLRRPNQSWEVGSFVAWRGRPRTEVGHNT
jgi:hypothetical protein